jgi:hypothetical protein
LDKAKDAASLLKEKAKDLGSSKAIGGMGQHTRDNL